VAASPHPDPVTEPVNAGCLDSIGYPTQQVSQAPRKIQILSRILSRITVQDYCPGLLSGTSARYFCPVTGARIKTAGGWLCCSPRPIKG